MMEKSTSERNTGIDLLRVISMLMVVMLHVLGQGGVIRGNIELTKSNYYISWLLETAAYCAVDVFAIISGFFIIDGNKRISILRLWVGVFFYSVILTIFAGFYGGRELLNLFVWKRAFFPIVFNQWWYVSAYFCLFFISPWVNKLLLGIEKDEYRRLLCVSIILFVVIPTLFSYNSFSMEYSPMLLMFLYSIGVYLRRFGFGFINNRKIAIGVYLFSSAIAYAVGMAIEEISFYLEGIRRGGGYLLSYTSPCMILQAVSLIYFFSESKFKPIFVKIIRIIAPSAFSIYLIHDHPLIFELFFRDKFSVYNSLPSVLFFLNIIKATLIILVSCIAIDMIKRLVFKLLRIEDLCLSVCLAAERMRLAHKN